MSTPTSNDIKQALENDYPFIPMSDISEEARMIAVSWMECGDKNWIGLKHKLASDIMNYSRRRAKERDTEILRLQNELADQKAFVGWIAKECEVDIYDDLFSYNGQKYDSVELFSIYQSLNPNSYEQGTMRRERTIY